LYQLYLGFKENDDLSQKSFLGAMLLFLPLVGLLLASIIFNYIQSKIRFANGDVLGATLEGV